MFVCNDCGKKKANACSSYYSGKGTTCKDCVQKPKWHGYLNHFCKNGIQAKTCSNVKVLLA